MAFSCNTTYMPLSIRVYDAGPDGPHRRWSREFGFGQSTGIKHLADEPGILPDAAYFEHAKRWRRRDPPVRAVRPDPARHRAGQLPRHAAAAGQRLRRHRQRRHALGAADRRHGDACPTAAWWSATSRSCRAGSAVDRRRSSRYIVQALRGGRNLLRTARPTAPSPASASRWPARAGRPRPADAESRRLVPGHRAGRRTRGSRSPRCSSTSRSATGGIGRRSARPPGHGALLLRGGLSDRGSPVCFDARSAATGSIGLAAASLRSDFVWNPLCHARP